MVETKHIHVRTIDRFGSFFMVSVQLYICHPRRSSGQPENCNFDCWNLPVVLPTMLRWWSLLLEYYYYYAMLCMQVATIFQHYSRWNCILCREHQMDRPWQVWILLCAEAWILKLKRARTNRTHLPLPIHQAPLLLQHHFHVTGSSNVRLISIQYHTIKQTVHSNCILLAFRLSICHVQLFA